eukprot:TRINITY_DN29222_c0_g1_i1.p1 TRINITY_DN29222_c0_g1~~TRINITY_DN29222_c0_g1_i1.p1  ORF type:complete len:252 (-),score=54.59 TRINITY_DN29222_c0_g1_i1:158-913(-)
MALCGLMGYDKEEVIGTSELGAPVNGDVSPDLEPSQSLSARHRTSEAGSLSVRVQALEDAVQYLLRRGPDGTHLHPPTDTPANGKDGMVTSLPSNASPASTPAPSLQNIQDMANALRADASIREIGKLLEGLAAGVQTELAVAKSHAGYSRKLSERNNPVVGPAPTDPAVVQALMKLQADVDLQSAKLRLQALTSSVFTLKCISSELSPEHLQQSLKALEVKQGNMQKSVTELERSYGRVPAEQNAALGTL